MGKRQGDKWLTIPLLNEEWIASLIVSSAIQVSVYSA